MKLSQSTRRRELRPALASLVQAALRLRLTITPDERKGTKGQGQFPEGKRQGAK